MENNYINCYVERKILPFYESLSNEELVEVYNEVILEKYDRAHAKADKRIILAVIKYALHYRGLNCRCVCHPAERECYTFTDLGVYVSCCIDGYLENYINTTSIIRLNGKILFPVGSPPLPKSSSEKSPINDFLNEVSQKFDRDTTLRNYHFKVSEKTLSASKFNLSKHFDLVTSDELITNTNDPRIPVFFSSTEEQEYRIGELAGKGMRLVAIIVIHEKKYELQVFEASGQNLSKKLFTIQ